MLMLRPACASLLLGLSFVHCLEPLPDPESSADSGTGGAAGTDSGTGGIAGEASSDGTLDGQTDASPDAPVDSSDLCTDATPVGYELRRLPPGTTLTAAAYCSDPFWASVPTLPLLVQATPATPSDNTATCKLVWSSESKPAVIWGCCNITDKDVRGSMTGVDSEAWKDDGLELLLKGNEQPAYDTTAQKTILSVAGGYRDSKWSSGIFDVSFSANVVAYQVLQSGSTLNDSTADKGFFLKWRQSLGFEPIPGQRARCDLAINDQDGTAGAMAKLVAFGADHAVDMSKAGTCRFSCAAP